MARALISVVIPTLNSCEDLAACLGSLGEGLSAGLIREVIVTDGGSNDGTRELAEEAGASFITGPKSRGGQLRRGCDRVSGEWLLVLHADTQLEPGWAYAVERHLATQGGAACFLLAFRANGLSARIVAAWANLRTRHFYLPYGDQGLLLRTKAYQQAGGYPDIPLMEDVALVRKLGKVSLLDGVASTSAEKYLRQGWLRRGTLNILMLLRYLLGANPERLAREYSSQR